MKNLKRAIFISTFICGSLAMPVVYADNVGNCTSEQRPFLQKMQERRGKKARGIYSQLNLTEEQKKQLEDNRLKHREEMKVAFDGMRHYKEALNQEFMKPNLDMNKVKEIQSQVKALQAKISDNHLNSIIEVRKILTPEQFVKFISFTQKHNGSPQPEEK